MHLVYSYHEANLDGERRHAQEVIAELGIQYTDCMPQSLGESFVFWNCTNVPSDLPPFIEQRNLNPFDSVGKGLSLMDALQIHMLGSAESKRSRDAGYKGSRGPCVIIESEHERRKEAYGPFATVDEAVGWWGLNRGPLLQRGVRIEVFVLNAVDS